MRALRRSAVIIAGFVSVLALTTITGTDRAAAVDLTLPSLWQSPGSGVASTTCADIDGPAYSFGFGSHTYSATAEDVAGNVGSGSTTFTVEVTYPSLETLVSRFSTSTDVASGLDDKLIAASQAKTTTARDNQLNAFENRLSAQAGKALTGEQAQILRTLERALRR